MINNKYFRACLLIAILILMALGLKYCNKPVPYVPLNVQTEIKTRDSIRWVVKYHDSVRVKVLKKWVHIKLNPDSLPCDTQLVNIINFCDTIIQVDSAVISNLKQVIKQDSIIEGKLFQKIAQDSLQICKLNKKLKRQKIITKFAFITGVGLGGFIGFKLN